MSILIGLHIRRTLERNVDVTKFVQNRIYPLVVPQGVETYPFICYDVSGASGDDTKDGVVDDVATVNIAVIAKTYEDAIILGNSVRYALEGKTAEYAELDVTECMNMAYNDEYIEALDAYAVNLSMDFRTEDK
jgi:hypothetical protein